MCVSEEMLLTAACNNMQCVAHQSVVVLNLLHGRFSGQGELDDLEVVQLLCGGCTAAPQPTHHATRHKTGPYWKTSKQL